TNARTRPLAPGSSERGGAPPRQEWPLENARWPSEVLSTQRPPLAHRWPAPPHTAWDIGPREAVALMSLSAPMSTGDPDCGKGLLRVPIPDAATLTLASVLLLVLPLFGRAARNHQHLHCALGFGIVHLLRESASFRSAVEPVFGIVD